jgi:acyl carrier protein
MSEAQTLAAPAASKSLQERIRAIVSEQLGVDAAGINSTTQFVVELTMAIEEAFEVEIYDEDAEKFLTPADIEAWLTKHGKA